MNNCDNNTAHFLSLSGGAFRGPVQYWPIYHLMVTLGISFRVISGTSVGSVNGSMASQYKFNELLNFYNGISNVGDFLSPRYFYMIGYPAIIIYRLLSKKLNSWFGWKMPIVIGGLRSMEPLRRKAVDNFKLADLKIPFVAGVVSSRTGTYYNLDTRKMLKESEWVDAVIASSCMTPFMKPPKLELEPGKGKEYGWDGGYRNIFPQPPMGDIEMAKNEGNKIIIHAIGCTSMERISDISNRENLDEISMILRAVEFFEAEIFENDILQLRKLAGSNGEVHLWVPNEDVGESMDASREAIQKRLEIGKRTVEQGPIILPGLD